MLSSVLVWTVLLLSLVVSYLDCVSVNTSYTNTTSDGAKFDFNGLMPAAFTPVNEDQTLNLELVPEYAQYLSDNGFKGVSVGGTTGEGMALSVDERKALHESWVAAGKPLGLHIQAQVGGAPFPDVIVLAKHAESIGANSILTLPELYSKPKTTDELVSFVRLVSNAVPNTPVLYYHNPGHSGVTLNMPSFAFAASAIPNFKGIKFTSNDLKEAAQTLNVLKDDQKICLGSDALLAPAALLGIDSFIGGSQSVFPQLSKDILQAVLDSDVPKARELQKRLSSALDAIGDSKTSLKAAMEVVTGMKVGPPKQPSAPMGSHARKKMADELRSLGFGVKRKHHKSS